MTAVVAHLLTFLTALTGTTLVLPPTSTVVEPLSGRIVPQSGSDLDTVGKLFTAYLQAQNISLIAKGVSVVPTGSNTPVSWLSTAFKTLSLPVTLMGQKFTVRWMESIYRIRLHLFRSSNPSPSMTLVSPLRMLIRLIALLRAPIAL